MKVKHISRLTALQLLSLRVCDKITDEGLSYLSKLTNLHTLILPDNNTPNNINISLLKQALPNTEITIDDKKIADYTEITDPADILKWPLDLQIIIIISTIIGISIAIALIIKLGTL